MVATAGVRAVSTNAVDGSSAITGQSTATSGFVQGIRGLSVSPDGPAIYGSNTATSSPMALAAGVRGDTSAPNGIGVYGFSTADSGGSGIGVRGDSLAAAGYGGYFTNSGGGTLIAAAVAGNIRFRVSAAGNVFADGSYNCGGAIDDMAGLLTEAEIAPCLIDDSPADFAEMLPTAGPDLEAGDVLVLSREGKLAASTKPYQSSVIGVFSTRPSYLGNSRYAGREGFAPVALVGIVPVKVTAENGPIRAGDLLVASTLRGHAMRGGKDAPQGTVIGKALESLDREVGVVNMVAMLQ